MCLLVINIMLKQNTRVLHSEFTSQNIGDRSGIMMSSSALSIVFTKLERFTGNNGSDLTTWIRNFERCCVIANKTDDLVKGQLMMLCVEGQALAVLEDLEERKKTPQKFTEIVTKLRSVFDTTATREAKMAAFEVRLQHLEESEDEFMLDLVKLFRAANPDVTPEVFDTAVKRKFLQGISPSLRKGIFVFCNKPYDVTVTRDILLEHCRDAKVQLQPSPSEIISETNKVLCVHDNVSSPKNSIEAPILQAIKELKLEVQHHISSTNQKLQEQEDKIFAINHYSGGNQQSNRFAASRNTSRNNNNRFTGYNLRNYRGANPSDQNDSKWYASNDRSQQQPEIHSGITCFKCGGANHLARHCLIRPGNQ